MSKIIKKSMIFITIFIISIGVCSCSVLNSHPQQTTTINYNSKTESVNNSDTNKATEDNNKINDKVNNNEGTSVSKDVDANLALKAIAEKLYQEYNNSVTIAEKSINTFLETTGNDEKKSAYNDAILNLSIARGKAIGILGVYKTYFTHDELSKVSEKINSLSSKISGGDIIYFGYSKSGLYVIGIAQPQSNVDFQSTDAINRIRNKNNEADFLSDLRFLTNNAEGYYAIDIYAEDLLEKSNALQFNDISIKEEDKTAHALTKVEDAGLLNVLSKYNRNINYDKTIINKNWSTFIFDVKGISQPQIILNYNGEDIILK